MELGKRIVFGVRVGGKVQWISIGLCCEVRSPQLLTKAPALKRGEKREESDRFSENAVLCQAIALLKPRCFDSA